MMSDIKDTEVTACASTSSNGDVGDIDAEALEKLTVGKRNLACDEYPQAVDILADACQLLAVKYGEQGDKLAEYYYYYGKALLELARVENGVLGIALDSVPAEEENEADLSDSEQFGKASEVADSEREDARGKIYSALSSEEVGESQSSEGDKGAGDQSESADLTTGKAETSQGADTSDSHTNDAEGATGDEETDPAAGDSKTEKSADSDEEEQSADDSEAGEDVDASSQGDEENPDDVPNLQLSWEVLELSKSIYSRLVEEDSSNTSIKARLSEVYRVLGEVSLETGAAEQAVLDMKACLELQEVCLESDSRYIAETHYQLGTAYLLGKCYEKAVEALLRSKSVIEQRIASIKQQLAEAEGDAGKEKLEKELNDLNQLLPDITSKVEDAEDEAMNAEKTETEIKAAVAMQSTNGSTTTIGFGSSSSSSSATATSSLPVKKANDISNLVRKRKIETPAEEESKKVKPDQTNSDGKENGHSDLPVESAN